MTDWTGNSSGSGSGGGNLTPFFNDSVNINTTITAQNINDSQSHYGIAVNTTDNVVVITLDQNVTDGKSVLINLFEGVNPCFVQGTNGETIGLDTTLEINGIATVSLVKAGTDWEVRPISLIAQFGDITNERPAQISENPHFLFHFHEQYRLNNASKVVYSGDSTTDAFFFYSSMYVALDHIYPNASSIEAGHSSHSTVDWLYTHLANDIAQNPDLYVIRWGINDNINENRTAQETANNIELGLIQFRATHSVKDCSIILMCPNPTDTSPEDDTFNSELSFLLRHLAVKYYCAYFDTDALLRDVQGGATNWYDPIGVATHPTQEMNALIVKELTDLILPSKKPQPKLLNYGTNTSSFNGTVITRTVVQGRMFLTGVVDVDAPLAAGEIIASGLNNSIDGSIHFICTSSSGAVQVYVSGTNVHVLSAFTGSYISLSNISFRV